MANDTYGARAKCPFYFSNYKNKLKCNDNDLILELNFRNKLSLMHIFMNFAHANAIKIAIYIYY